MEWNFDEIWEELETLETMTPEKKNNVKDNLVSGGICGMKYFRFTPFKDEVTTDTYWMRQEKNMEFYVVYKDDYQYSEVFYTRQRAEEYLYFTQIMEPKSNLHIESVLEEI